MSYVMGSSARRRPEIDAVRGIAVTMVAGAHVVLGLVDSGRLTTSSPLYVAYDVSHVFRVATIMFVAGLFVPTSLERHGAARLLRDRAVLFGWLYVVWWSIQTIVGLCTNPLRNTPTPLSWETLAIWNPPAQLYFFPALWVGTALTVLVLTTARRWASPSARTRGETAGCVLLAAVAVATWGWLPPVMGVQYLALACFVCAGAVLGIRRVRSVLDRLGVLAWTAVIAVAVLVFAAALPLGVVGPTDSSDLPWTLRVLSLVATCAGIVALFATTVVLCRFRPFGLAAAWVGERTVVVFTAHIVFAAGARIALDLVGASVPVTVLLAWSVGLAGPFALAAVAPRLRLGWLFAPPRWLDAGASVAPRPIADGAVRPS